MKAPLTPEIQAALAKLPNPTLRRLSRQAFKNYVAMGKHLKTPLEKELNPLREHFGDTWEMLYQEEDRRKLAAATKADRGEVMFETFYPRRYTWERQEVFTRTPHRKIELKFYRPEAYVNVVAPADWLADFKKVQVAA